MAINDNNVKQKNKISIGKILSKEDFRSTIFPEEVKYEINEAPYYLLIFISREDSIKISCFPAHTQNIKKILIKLIEFSPDLVKGISTVLNELNLSRDILHTTGICYELENCFYETYLLGFAIAGVPFLIMIDLFIGGYTFATTIFIFVILWLIFWKTWRSLSSIKTRD